LIVVAFIESFSFSASFFALAARVFLCLRFLGSASAFLYESTFACLASTFLWLGSFLSFNAFLCACFANAFACPGFLGSFKAAL